MDAKHLRIWALAAFSFIASLAHAATYSTTNFVVTAPTEEIARKVGKCAEFWRHDLAVQWLGEPLPNWYSPCPITVRVGQLGAGGSTTFTFENGEVFGWRMQVQGSLERILDSVIPHEVNHTIFASYFRRPLPRWADEGAATLFEHESERARQTRLLNQVVSTSRKYSLKELFAIREYPKDIQDVLTLYAQGYSLAEFLVGSQGEDGRATYLLFLTDAPKIGWDRAIKKHYGLDGVTDLETEWTGWVLAGSPEFNIPDGTMLANVTEDEKSNVIDASGESDVVIRAQSPGGPEPLPSIDRPLRGSHPDDAGRQLQLRQTAETPLSAELGGTNPDAGGSRSHSDDQPKVRPSRPTELTPTADGIFSDPKAPCYSFPKSRNSSAGRASARGSRSR